MKRIGMVFLLGLLLGALPAQARLYSNGGYYQSGLRSGGNYGRGDCSPWFNRSSRSRSSVRVTVRVGYHSDHYRQDYRRRHYRSIYRNNYSGPSYYRSRRYGCDY